MTTSGQTIIEMSRDSICNAAFRKLGVIALGGTASATEITNATEALNNLVAELQTLGMPLWSRKTYSPALVAGTGTYRVGVGQTWNTPFFLKVLQAWLVTTTGGSKQELYPNAIDNFNRLPTQQSASGSPSQFMYQPFINFGDFSVWPLPDATTVSTKTLTISYLAPFEGFVSASDTPYFPREFNNTLIYGLCDLLAPEYGTPLNDRGMFKKEYEAHRELALDFGLENASLTFQPNERFGDRNG